VKKEEEDEEHKGVNGSRAGLRVTPPPSLKQEDEDEEEQPPGALLTKARAGTPNGSAKNGRQEVRLAQVEGRRHCHQCTAV
jgi:hypothetical protein